MKDSKVLKYPNINSTYIERGEKNIILVFGKKNVCKNISLDVKKEKKRIREEKKNHKNV